MKLIYRPQGAVVGRIENGVYHVKKNPRKHLMKIWNAYGISKSILDNLEKQNIKVIRIEELGNSKVYSVPVQSFVASAKKFNFNGDVQHFVSLDEMTQNKNLISKGWLR